MKTKILCALFLIFSLYSCKDILSTEPLYIKKLIRINLSPEDSITQLQISPMDLGTVSMVSTTNDYISIINKSSDFPVTIFSLIGKNTSGLFNYSFPYGMPVIIQPGEDTKTTRKIQIKFIADTFTPGMYFDTLVINNNPAYFVPIKVNVKF